MRTIKYFGLTILILAIYSYGVLYIDREFNDYFKNDLESVALLVGLAIVSFVMTSTYEKRKIWGPEIKGHLTDKGLKLITERPLTILESFKHLEWSFRPTILINGTPIELLGKLHSNRLLTVTDSQEKNRQICVGITKSWFTGKVRLEIIKELMVD